MDAAAASSGSRSSRSQPRVPPGQNPLPAAMNPPGERVQGGAESGPPGAAAATPTPPESAQKDKEESLEEKLRSLTFRKQVSYR
ncbi:hypothetical protein NDU88_006743 [Pleurodeles waltl]|uniref:Uncharacterized protein n=2 Tax=Pleurodeles waltl TaxID=8319 RepID=A0AAV7SQE2_PLEWA|nr:hypothetical protein NDU88_006743 [Pleurodeles waltl]